MGIDKIKNELLSQFWSAKSAIIKDWKKNQYRDVYRQIASFTLRFYEVNVVHY